MNFDQLKAFIEHSPLLWLALAGLTVAIIFTEIRRLTRGYKTLSPAQLTHLINREDALVIDLSASGDFEKGHIAGSRNVLASQFGPDHKTVSAARQLPVVVVCGTGVVSAAAAAKLKKAGFANVHWLDGGINAWRAADLPTIKGR